MGRVPQDRSLSVVPDNSVARGSSAVVPVIASLVVAALALTNQSLWIDEAHSALKAMQPSLASWWHIMVSEKGSDLQMPLYMAYLWAWEKVTGHSEIVLRLSNVPWLILAHYALWQVGAGSSRMRILLLTVASVNPFLWSYLDEVRPYLMQYAGACVLCVLLFRTAKDPARGTERASLWVLTLGLLVLCGSSLLGVIWAAFATAAWLYLIRGQLRSLWQPSKLLPLATASVCLAALGAYYLWTMSAGGGAADSGRTRLLNLAFAFYELVGAAGLGPGRLEIRQHGLAAFRAHGVLLLPLAIGLLLFLALLVFALARAWKQRSRPAIIAGWIYAIPPTVLLFAFAYSRNFRLLGRHLMPLLPVIIGVFAFGISELRHRRAALIIFAALVVTWLGSALSLRFGERHRKDDYRAAASIARRALAQEDKVWWSADDAAAAYYGVPIGKSAEGSATRVAGLTRLYLDELPDPDVIIASKPDIYDPADELGSFLRRHAFNPVQRLPAFTIWRKAADPPAGR